MQSYTSSFSRVSAFLIVATSMLQPLLGSDIVGTVADSDGKPIAGAIVGIYTAGPRVGRGIL